MPDSSPHHHTSEGERLGLPSLLWPLGYPPESHRPDRMSAETSNDLDIAPLVQALSGDASSNSGFVSGLLMDLCTDSDVIAYRAEVVDNLLESPELRARLLALLPSLSTLVRERQRPLFRRQWTAGEFAQRLGELEMYVEVASRLAAALDAADVCAPALQVLRTSIHALIGTAEFKALCDDLPELRAHVEGMKSVTIGVNLSDDLRPESATILSIDNATIEGRGGVLHRLLGREIGERGITPLRGTPGGVQFPFFPPMVGDRKGHDNVLVDDLRRLLEEVMAPVGKAVERYVWARTRDFAVLERELSFLLNGAALIERLRNAGLPMCRPAFAPIGQRLTCLDGGYNISLALRMMHGSEGSCAVVTSPITFDAAHARVWILTGPNRGGKTTYTRAVGLAHLLFQAGLYAPAESARMSPVDAVYTHFPVREPSTPGEGRLDDEARRLAEIFREATPHSLILLNEVLSGTSTIEALALAYDAVRGVRLLGARAIYVTHLHELAASTEEINRMTNGDSIVASLLADVAAPPGDGETAHRRTFQIRPGPPLGLSYASEIAEQHGISFRQIACLLQSRGFGSSAP